MKQLNNPLKAKTLKRDEWPRVLSKSFTCTEKSYGDFRCVIGILVLHEVTAPLKKTMFGTELVLADRGYHWLQIAPEGQSWWLTVMLDHNDNIVQYYFDITDHNLLDGEQSFFYDLYLDVVVLPDGRAAIIDKDELDAALQDGILSPVQHKTATAVATQLLQDIPPRLAELKMFVMTAFHDVTKKEN